MKIGRRQTTAIILADGKVLVTGGSSQCGFTNEAGAVFAPELYDPAAVSPADPWTTMANASVVRVYHSTTVLLPDGRVLSVGSGDGGGVTQQYIVRDLLAALPLQGRAADRSPWRRTRSTTASRSP